MIGVAMFGATVYLSQYFQLARGMSPTEAGLMSIAMVGGLLVSSIVSGRIISDTGLWKRWLVGGLVLVIVGFSLLAHDRRRHPARAGRPLHGHPRRRPRRDDAEPRARRAEQHQHRPTWARPARSSRSSARSVARSASRCSARSWPARSPTRSRPAAPRSCARASRPPTQQHESHSIPDLSALPAPWRDLYEHSFGTAVGHIFLVAVPFAILALVAVLFIKEVPLRTSVGDDVAEPGSSTAATDPIVPTGSGAGARPWCRRHRRRR